MNHFGPESGKKHGYPGHPEIELAILRLYQVTQDQRHLDFAHYLLAERGVTRKDLDDQRYYVWEAKQRGDETIPGTMDDLLDTALVMHSAGVQGGERSWELTFGADTTSRTSRSMTKTPSRATQFERSTSPRLRPIWAESSSRTLIACSWTPSTRRCTPLAVWVPDLGYVNQATPWIESTADSDADRGLPRAAIPSPAVDRRGRMLRRDVRQYRVHDDG